MQRQTEAAAEYCGLCDHHDSSAWRLVVSCRGGSEKTKTVDAKIVENVDVKLMRRPTFWRRRRDGLGLPVCRPYRHLGVHDLTCDTGGMPLL